MFVSIKQSNQMQKPDKNVLTNGNHKHMHITLKLSSLPNFKYTHLLVMPWPSSNTISASDEVIYKYHTNN